MTTLSEQDDCDLIASFQWIDWDDNAPLPVDPSDPSQMRAAYLWATKEYRRYEEADFLARHGHGYSEDDGRIIHHDKQACGLFLAALKRQFHRMRQRDSDALAAWNNGEPIRA
jgi:hypothetical protein